MFVTLYEHRPKAIHACNIVCILRFHMKLNNAAAVIPIEYYKILLMPFFNGLRF